MSDELKPPNDVSATNATSMKMKTCSGIQSHFGHGSNQLSNTRTESPFAGAANLQNNPFGVMSAFGRISMGHLKGFAFEGIKSFPAPVQPVFGQISSFGQSQMKATEAEQVKPNAKLVPENKTNCETKHEIYVLPCTAKTISKRQHPSNAKRIAETEQKIRILRQKLESPVLLMSPEADYQLCPDYDFLNYSHNHDLDLRNLDEASSLKCQTYRDYQLLCSEVRTVSVAQECKF